MAKQEKEYKYNIGLYDVAHRNFILSLFDEYNIEYKELYQSKYNKYVIFDSEPFCTEGFYYSVEVKGEPNVVNFIDYLIKQHIENIEELNKLIKETKEDK